jgi:hypothetical protein
MTAIQKDCERLILLFRRDFCKSQLEYKIDFIQFYYCIASAGFNIDTPNQYLINRGAYTKPRLIFYSNGQKKRKKR